MLDADLLRLFADSPYHKHYSSRDMERVIVPAMRNNKYMIHEDDEKIDGFMTWAFLFPHQSEGYLNRTRKLKPIDFARQQGELWFIDFLAPYGNTRQVIRDFQKEFQKRYPDIKFGKMFRRAKGYDARVIVRTT